MRSAECPSSIFNVVVIITVAKTGFAVCAVVNRLSLWNVLSIVFGCLGFGLLCFIVYVVTRRPFRSRWHKWHAADDRSSQTDKKFTGSPRNGPLRWTSSLLAAAGGLRQRTSAITSSNDISYFVKYRRKSARTTPQALGLVP